MNVPSKPDAQNTPEGVELVNGEYVFKDADGVSFIWDAKQNAWFPMWQDDLVTQQQSAYGEWQPPANQNSSSDSHGNEQDNKKKRKGGKDDHQPQQANTIVYVTGLPSDITMDEMKTHFEKCGLIKEDFETGQPKIKIYKDEQGNPKGDAFVAYYKPESVPLAIQILDETEIKPGFKIKIEEAHFEGKAGGEAVKKKKLDKKVIKQRLQKMEKKLQWFEESSGPKPKYARVVILKHMFTLEEIEKDPGVIIDIKNDIREECEKLGEVSSIMLFDNSEEGVCSVKFKSEESAAACIEMMNGRWFGGRKIEAYVYDGKEKYKTKQKDGADAEKEEAERLEKFAQWLEGKE